MLFILFVLWLYSMRNQVVSIEYVPKDLEGLFKKKKKDLEGCTIIIILLSAIFPETDDCKGLICGVAKLMCDFFLIKKLMCD